MSGTLYLCATPIGNLGDITLRTLECLKNADVIAAEDTRNSMKLMTHFDIHTPLTSYHEHNKHEKAEKLLERLIAGDNVALITDAGTPVISDPGEVLVKRCLEAGVEVTALPGASAAVTALILSGLGAGRFAFEGFLPQNKPERKALLEELKDEYRTMILYEAPHRLKATLSELAECFGDRRIAVARELTKIHEEVVRCTVREAAGYFEATEPKGEFVLVLEGKDRDLEELEKKEGYLSMSIIEHMDRYLSAGMDRKEAMKRVARDRGVSKREVYAELIKTEDDQDE